LSSSKVFRFPWHSPGIFCGPWATRSASRCGRTPRPSAGPARRWPPDGFHLDYITGVRHFWLAGRAGRCSSL